MLSGIFVLGGHPLFLHTFSMIDFNHQFGNVSLFFSHCSFSSLKNKVILFLAAKKVFLWRRCWGILLIPLVCLRYNTFWLLIFSWQNQVLSYFQSVLWWDFLYEKQIIFFIIQGLSVLVSFKMFKTNSHDIFFLEYVFAALYIFVSLYHIISVNTYVI